MGKSVVFLGLVIAVAPAVAFAQANPGARDGTNDVRSANIGTPGSSTNAEEQYLRRRGLQDLSAGPGGGKDAGKLGSARLAKPDELTAGVTVNDKTGVAIAKIEQVDPDGIVVSTGLAKVKVPK